MHKVNFCGKYFLILFLVISGWFSAHAQFDTLYAVKYPSKLGFSLFQSRPSYDITLSQKLTRDTLGISGIKYSTLAKDVTGVGFFYDKISLFIGFKTPVNQAERIRKGKTNFSQFALAITGAKLRLEASQRSYKGFYDQNSANYIPDFTDTTKYFQNSDLVNRSFRIKAFYFVNKKRRFSYGAAYVNNVRQLKSAGSLIIATNMYHFVLNSSNIVPPPIDSYYGDWKGWNQFNITALTAGLGYTYTLTVFKRAFVNALFTVGMEAQHIKALSNTTDQRLSYWRTQISAYDFRSSIGFNSNSFFISLQNLIDGNNYRLSLFDVSNVYISTFLNIGYRFPVKTPPFYKKIQETKLYKMI